MHPALTFVHALADPTRWRIAMLLADQTLCVCELEDGLLIAQSSLSSHLSTMRGAGLLEVERQDKWAFYSMAPALRPLFHAIREHFSPSIAAEAQFTQDRKRTAVRVALRGKTNCKSPRRRAIPPVRAGAAAAPCC